MYSYSWKNGCFLLRHTIPGRYRFGLEKKNDRLDWIVGNVSSLTQHIWKRHTCLSPRTKAAHMSGLGKIPFHRWKFHFSLSFVSNDLTVNCLGAAYAAHEYANILTNTQNYKFKLANNNLFETRSIIHVHISQCLLRFCGFELLISFDLWSTFTTARYHNEFVFSTQLPISDHRGNNYLKKVILTRQGLSIP